MASEQEKRKEDIECTPEVSYACIKNPSSYCPEKCTNCANVMAIASRILSKASETCRKNLEMTCYGNPVGNHVALCLWSGSRGNKITIKINNGVQVDVTRVSWREWLSGSLKKLATEIRKEAERQLYQQTSVLEKECSPEVTHRDINKYCDYCTSDKCTSCNRMMQIARLITTNATKSCRKNLEILCYGNHISLCFCSGSRKYQIVIQVIEDKIWLSTTTDIWPFVKEMFEHHNELENVLLTVTESDTLDARAHITFPPPLENAIVLRNNNLSSDNINAGQFYRITNA